MLQEGHVPEILDLLFTLLTRRLRLLRSLEVALETLEFLFLLIFKIPLRISLRLLLLPSPLLASIVSLQFLSPPQLKI